MDVEGLSRLRQLYQQGGGSEGGQPGGASIVYIPAHKSHLDYLMLRCGTLLVVESELVWGHAGAGCRNCPPRDVCSIHLVACSGCAIALLSC